jgi:hypothetical protein
MVRGLSLPMAYYGILARFSGKDILVFRGYHDGDLSYRGEYIGLHRPQFSSSRSILSKRYRGFLSLLLSLTVN